MKKGTKLVALLLGLALVAPACNKPAVTTSQPAGDQSSEPAQSSEAPVNYKVTISNKEELQAEWFVGDPSRKVNIETDPKANISQLVNEGKITITSSDAQKLAITGQMASPVAAGEITITVKCGDSIDTVKVTLKAKQTVKEKYGVNHEGTEADPFDNEDACKVARSDKYNNEDFYVKGVVSSFYHAPGSRTDGAVSFYLTPAEGKTEKFEVYKCFKDKEQKQFLTDDDIWVGGTVTAHGQFTVYNDTQAETTAAIFVKCEGEKPQPRQTLEKTFAEVLAIGNALADGASSWDYVKFQGYVTEKVGNDYYLTATKGEALVPGKSDADHQEKDIKGTNAIELYGAGKVTELAAKLTKNAKVEVTMIVKNYHGTIENGLDLKDADVTVKEAGEPWNITYVEKNVAEALAVINALEDGKTAEGYYAVTGVVAEVTTAYNAQYGNMSFTLGDEAANLLTCFRVKTDAETAAKVVAGVKVIVKGQLQKYVKDGAMTPELINGSVEIVPEHVVTYTTVGSLSFNKDTTVVIDNKLEQETDPFINYASTSGVAITVRKNTSSSGVNVWKADYASCRWYVGHKVNIAHANDFDRVVLTCDSGYDTFKPESDETAKTIAALKEAGITYSEDNGKIILDLATPAKSIEIVPDKQIRPSNVELLKSDSGETPAVTALKEWDAAETKAGLSNASAKEVKDTTGDVQFTVYKLGTKNDYVEFKYTATEAKKVSFYLTFTTKHGNADKTYFWNQDAAITSARKHQIFVNGTEIGYPAENPSFKDMAGDQLVKSEASDSGELANPITVELFEFDLVANQENVIKVQYIGSGYSCYVGGAMLIAK